MKSKPIETSEALDKALEEIKKCEEKEQMNDEMNDKMSDEMNNEVNNMDEMNEQELNDSSVMIPTASPIRRQESSSLTEDSAKLRKAVFRIAAEKHRLWRASHPQDYTENVYRLKDYSF